MRGPHTALPPVALEVLHVPARMRVAVLLLPGGRSEDRTAPTRLDLPARRMTPFARALRRRLPGDVVLTARVRYRYRGWNGQDAHPVQDAGRALEELASFAPGLPVVLIGHSMGGRAAIAAAGRPQVRGVVALAPWCPPGDPVDQLAGRSLVVLHDRRDRVTSAVESFALARRAAAAGARVELVPMPRGRHAMLRNASMWHRLTVEAVASVLTGVPLLPAASSRG
ncbi:alpha/beta fold hydrolase [Kitasatospora sp. NPDC101447]|uniref:alpha/beta fold hydrolase n=1 Tax=Kitasatospora sp. NPDC101447 TaxID=3364102 RepID=UPI003809D982